MASIWNCCLLLLVAVSIKAQYQGPSYDEPKQQYQPQPQQYREPANYAGQEPRRPLPAIIMHKQALTQDGAFNFAFAADNGLQQGETINPDGSRTGSYSYVDPHGKTIKVKYSAGKDGFRVLEGDHLPRAPQPSPQAAEPAPAPAQYNHPQPSGPRYSAQPPFRAGPSVAGAYRVNGGYETPNLGTTAIFGGPTPQPKPIYQVREDHEPSLFRASSPAQIPASYQQPRPRPAPSREVDYNEEKNNEPHSFGSGYSFEFSG
ncbi:Cuticle protein 6 [Gryllus bimaculatus]|nr:Cuticle protein 6 [Gryllus bimaculatus]